METFKREWPLALIIAMLLTLNIAYAFSHASAATIFSTPSPFKQGGANNTQIVPAFPTWSVNIPLATPTNFASATSTTGGSLTANSKMYFEVVAINATGTSTPSSEIATTTYMASSRFHLTWTPVPGATGYAIFYSTSTPGAENAYQIATTTNAFDFTSTSTPTYATPPGFPTAFAVQLTNGTNPIQVNGINVSPLATTTAALGGGALGAGKCATATSTLAVGSVSSSTVFLTTPQTYPGGYDWNSYALSSTTIVTQVCALIAGTPVSTAYNVRAF